MSGERIPGKVIFETQSTHKMLAALSQASLIHIKGNYDEETFNEAFMMHTSTSPSYPIVASIETAAAMLRGNSGKRLIQRSIERALDFRKEVQRLREESDGWFFDIWQPEAVDKAGVLAGGAWRRLARFQRCRCGSYVSRSGEGHHSDAGHGRAGEYG